MIHDLAHGIFYLFPLSEIGLAVWKRSKRGTATAADRGSMAFLWIVIFLSIAAAIGCEWVRGAAMHLPDGVRQGIALLLMVVGLGVRWHSIITLGRFFTVDVAAHRDHRLVESGFYRYVRHPSYTGLLLTFAGMGFLLANWLSLVVLVAPITLAFLRRIALEERVLREVLGEAYVAYSARTKRLVPGIY